MTTNTDALNDPNYNPTIDAVTLQIFNMMDEPSDELYSQYQAIFDNLPTTNPFGGVLINPVRCDTQAVNDSVDQAVTALQNYGNQTFPNDPTWFSEIIDPSNPSSAVSQLTGGNTTVDPSTGAVTYTQPDSVIASTAAAESHTDKLLANLPMILGIVQQALGLATALEGLLNPCMGMDSFLGSLKGAMNAILKKIKSAIDAIKNIINQGLEILSDCIKAIQDAISYIKGLVSDLINFIAAEIKKLVKAMIDALRAGLAAFLNSLHLDPCLKSLVGGVTTMAAAAVL